MALKLLLPGLIGLYGLAVVALRGQSDRARAWAERVARRIPGAVLLDEGRRGVAIDVDGIEVRAACVEGMLDGEGLALESTVPAPLPAALDLRAAHLLFGDQAPVVRVGIDGMEVRALDAPWARRALSGGAVQDALAAVQALGSVVVAAGVVRVVRTPRTEPHRVDEDAAVVAAFVRALAERSGSDWQAQGALRGLSLDVHGPSSMALASPDGAVCLRYDASGPMLPGLQVLRFRVGGAFPAGVRMRARRSGERGGPRLGDLILDRGLRAAGGGPELGPRLGQDAVRGPLLDFLHGGDAPRVRDGALLLSRTGGGQPALLARLDEVRSLAGLLEAAWR